MGNCETEKEVEEARSPFYKLLTLLLSTRSSNVSLKLDEAECHDAGCIARTGCYACVAFSMRIQGSGWFRFRIVSTRGWPP